MAKRKSRAKAKPAVEKKDPLLGKKLTMKLTLGTPKRCFLAGSTVVVGRDIPVDTARGWIGSGHAELTAEAPGPSEVK